jgi:AraC-like DNA-binding protein
MADTPKVQNMVARQILRELKEAGIATAPLLLDAGLKKYQLNRDRGWIPYECHALLMEAAAREMDDLYYGLNLARRIDPRDFDALAYIGLSSATLEDALLNLERYLSVHTEAWTLDLEMQSRSVGLHLTPAHPDLYSHVQAAECGAAAMINAYQFFLADKLVPLEVHFVHALDPNRSKAYIEEQLGCPVGFNQNRSQIILDRKLMLLPIATADDRLLRILKRHCEQVLKDREPQPSNLVTDIRQTIVKLLPSGQAKADTIATELGLTLRTMHRRLAERGLSFTEIHNDICRDLAERYINEERLNFQQVAFLLGYADQSAFSVAFKRWTGRTPTEVRAQH